MYPGLEPLLPGDPRQQLSELLLFPRIEGGAERLLVLPRDASDGLVRRPPPVSLKPKAWDPS